MYVCVWGGGGLTVREITFLGGVALALSCVTLCVHSNVCESVSVLEVDLVLC